MEASQMRTHMSRLIIPKLRQVQMPTDTTIPREVLDRRVDSRCPGVYPERVAVVC